MNDQELERRNNAKLSELLDHVRQDMTDLIQAMKERGYRVRIQESYRSQERQRELWKQGLTQLQRGSNHTRRRAIDVVHDDQPLTPSDRFMAELAIVAWNLKLSTGLLWGLPAPLRRQRSDAMHIGDVETLARLIGIKRGWDPLHIEPIAKVSIAAKKVDLRKRK